MNKLIAMTFGVMMTASVANAGENYVNASLGGTVNNQSGYGSSAVYNVNVGTSLTNNVRGQIGLDRTTTGTKQTQGEVEMDSILAGVMYDFDSTSKLTPFAGVNLGYGFGEGTGVEAANDNGLLYGISLGTNYDLGNDWAVVGQFRHLRSSSISVSTSSGIRDYRSNALTVGLQTNF